MRHSLALSMIRQMTMRFLVQSTNPINAEIPLVCQSQPQTIINFTYNSKCVFNYDAAAKLAHDVEMQLRLLRKCSALENVVAANAVAVIGTIVIITFHR